jgi:hypothetical protein
MRGRLIVLILVAPTLAGVASAWAYWTSSGDGVATASTGTLNPPPPPTLSYTKGTAAVEVDWSPGSTLNDGTTPAQGYYVTRDNGSTTSPACGTSPTALATTTSCTDEAVPDGTYTYRVVAVWHSFSAVGSAGEPVAVALSGGALSNSTWTTSKSQAGTTGATYTYGFSTATGASLTSVTMTVPPGTGGVPAVGTVKGVPGGGSVSLEGDTLTYSFAARWVNPGTAASIQITGLANTPNVNSYTAQITTHSATAAVDSGITAAVAFTGGTLRNPTWTTSTSQGGATGATYTYGFTTATSSSMSSVTMTVPPGTAGTPAVGTVSGVPAGGAVSMSNNTLTYSFPATAVASSTACSIQVTGLSNTSAVGSYSSQITTNDATVPIDNAATAPVAVTGGALSDPTWTTSNSQAGATEASYTYGFTTATGASLTAVTMTVPPGTGGTPSIGAVLGVPAGGTVSLEGNTLTYTFAARWVNPGTAASIQVDGLTNTATTGSYTSQIATHSATAPIDSAAAAPLAFTGGSLSNPIWTTSKSQVGSTRATYAYGFVTATGASLTAVTMTVPPGTGGVPTVGAVKGLPSGGTVSLEGDLLTYAFPATGIATSTTVAIEITGVTNTATAGSYTSQIATHSAAAPIDSGSGAPISFAAGALVNPVWATSEAESGAREASYTYGFTTATGASLTAVTMTVPPGTGGSPIVGAVKGVPARGTVSLEGNMLTYAFAARWVNPGTPASIQVDGLTNTSTVGSYTSEITTDGTTVGGPSIPIDNGGTPAVLLGDSTPPTGSIGYPDGYDSTGSVTITFDAIDEGTGVDTAAGQLKRASAPLSGGSCGGFGGFKDVGPEGVVSPYVDSSLMTDTCYEYEYVVPDDYGVQGAIGPGGIVKADTTAPLNALSLTAASGGGSYLAGTTLYYRGSVAGSFEIEDAVSDAGSGPASSVFPPLGGTTAGWSHAGSTTSAPAGGPYASEPFSWAASTTSSPSETVTGADAAGNTTATTVTLTDDTTAPSGGAITVPAHANTTSVEVTFSAGTDSGSGIDTGSGQLERATATYSEPTDTCGSFGGFEEVGPVGPISPFADTGLSSGRCYEYEYVVADNVGNPTVYGPSTAVKVDTTRPSIGAITSTDRKGKPATRKIQNGSTVTITFKRPTAPAGIASGCPESCTITGAEEIRKVKRGTSS